MQNYQDTDGTRLEVVTTRFHMPSDITKKISYFPSLLQNQTDISEHTCPHLKTYMC